MGLLPCLLWVVGVVFVVVHANPAFVDITRYRTEADEWLARVNDELLEFTQICTKLTWDIMIYGTDEPTRKKMTAIGEARIAWKNRVCDTQWNRALLDDLQQRALYLLCRGPKFTEHIETVEMQVLSAMQAAYDNRVCLNNSSPTPFELLRSPDQQYGGDYPQPGDCMMAEPDLEYLIKRQDFNAAQLAFVWFAFHDEIAAKIRVLYPMAVVTQNHVARANGYADMGALWRSELEMPGLEEQVEELFREIRPLYEILHAVVRHKLYLRYGDSVMNPQGSIPIHLTGNMWGQNWRALMGLFFNTTSLDLDRRLKEKGWSVQEMLMQAEDFYTSLGLPAMTEKFWKYSIFQERENSSMCHGTAADLFTGDDYRILLCAKVNMEDLYVIHHEMGHIEYNMAYAHQPAIFREGVNSAFHESIGDTIMHGVMVPQHLHRLNLITDDELLSPDIDTYLLLQQALSKIPEIPFGLIVDEYRWNIFNGRITPDAYNGVYWTMNERVRGIRAPENRSEAYFDAGAKFHVPDNTPYIRYFLSSILQMQIFKGLCDISLFGHFQHDAGSSEEEAIHMPMHRCDIYGCKKCGKLLEEALSLGASVHWTQVLKILTGKDYISTKPLLDYYLPIYEWLKRYVELNDVPIGW